MVVLGIELSAAALSEPLGQSALDYRFQVGHLGVEPRSSWSQTRRASICTCTRSISDPCGSRTQPPRCERPMTSPEVERAMSCALRERKWAGRCSNPRLRFFRPPPTNAASVPASQLPARVVSMWARKNPMSFVTPGFDDPKKNRSSVTSANVARAAYSPVDWRCYLCFFVRI